MAKHTQTIPWQKPTNSLSVFDHFVRLAHKGLSISRTPNLKLFKNGTSSKQVIGETTLLSFD